MGRQLPKKVLDRRRGELRHLFRTIEQVVDEDKRRLGDSREHLAGQALELLRKAAVIASFERTLHGDEDDRHGKDYLIHCFDGTVMPLQIKGSYTGVREHLERHPDIAVVFVRREDPVHEVAARISTALRIPLSGSLAHPK